MEIIRSREFDEWLKALRDPIGKARIVQRMLRMAERHFGDFTPVGGGINELRIGSGPGYRIFWMRSSDIVVVLLCGGDKSTQSRDIARAKEVALVWRGRTQ